MTKAPGHPFLVPYPDEKERYVAVVANPNGELWGKISKKRSYVNAVKDCHNKDGPCGCSDWPGLYMDAESLHEGTFGHSRKEPWYSCWSNQQTEAMPADVLNRFDVKKVGELVLFSDVESHQQAPVFMCIIRALQYVIAAVRLPGVTSGGLSLHSCQESHIVLRYRLEQEQLRALENCQHTLNGKEGMWLGPESVSMLATSASCPLVSWAWLVEIPYAWKLLPTGVMETCRCNT